MEFDRFLDESKIIKKSNKPKEDQCKIEETKDEQIENEQIENKQIENKQIEDEQIENNIQLEEYNSINQEDKSKYTNENISNDTIKDKGKTKKILKQNKKQFNKEEYFSIIKEYESLDNKKDNEIKYEKPKQILRYSKDKENILIEPIKQENKEEEKINSELNKDMDIDKNQIYKEELYKSYEKIIRQGYSFKVELEMYLYLLKNENDKYLIDNFKSKIDYLNKEINILEKKKYALQVLKEKIDG